MKRHVRSLLIQFFSIFVLSFLFYLLRPVSVLYNILMFIILPIASAYTSFELVKRMINPYLAWILPAIAETLAGFLSSLGIGPNPLPIMITAFVSLIGSATGDVSVKFKKRIKHEKHEYQHPLY